MPAPTVRLEQLLDQLRPDDTLVVRKLDRLGRSPRHLVDTVTGLAERGIGFRSLQESRMGQHGAGPGTDAPYRDILGAI